MTLRFHALKVPNILIFDLDNSFYVEKLKFHSDDYYQNINRKSESSLFS
jgi:hypothetical protein